MKTKACEIVLTRDLAYYPYTGAVFFRGQFIDHALSVPSLVTVFGVPFFTFYLGKLKRGPDLPIPLDVLKQWADIQSWAEDHSQARR